METDVTDMKNAKLYKRENKENKKKNVVEEKRKKAI